MPRPHARGQRVLSCSTERISQRGSDAEPTASGPDTTRQREPPRAAPVTRMHTAAPSERLLLPCSAGRGCQQEDAARLPDGGLHEPWKTEGATPASRFVNLERSSAGLATPRRLAR